MASQNSLLRYIEDIPDKTIWLNAEYINGVDIANPNIGDSINTWMDLSGNGRNLVYHNSPITTGMTAPLFKNTTFYNNTVKVVEFNATNKTNLTRNLDSGIFGTINECTILLVSQWTGDVDLINSSYGDGTNFKLSNLFQFKDIYDAYGSSFGNRGFNNGARFKNDIGIFQYKKESSSGLKNGIAKFVQTIGINETAQRTPIGIPESENSGFFQSNPQYKLSFGAFYIQTNSSYSNFGSGNIMEFCIWGRLLNPKEINQIQSYIHSKYNV